MPKKERDFNNMPETFEKQIEKKELKVWISWKRKEVTSMTQRSPKL
jgi:hypothetical protein